MKAFPSSWLRISFCLVGVTIFTTVTYGTTITVTSNADAGGTCPGTGCTLRQAITAAASGDTINFSLPAHSTITLTTTELLINKNLTISGPGATTLTVQRSTAVGTPSFRIFNISGNFNVTISGLTTANGASTGGGQVAGGIENLGGTLALANVTLSSNFASGGGGGILNNNNGTLTITNCLISSNGGSNGSGGGISNLAGTVTVTNSTLLQNSASTGGGISNNGTLTIINSTLSGNFTNTATGGGISNNGTANVTNTTISGNTANSNGGGIYNSGTVNLTNDTISANSAQSGGGILFSSGTVNSRNTIIALNTASSGPNGPDISGTLTSQGYNLIGNNSGATIAATTGDQIGTSGHQIDPMLGPLQDNGGPTKTQALLSGSTAIEKGNSAGYTTDQRGFARPVDDPSLANATGGDGSDIGAYEVQASQLPGCNAINKVVNNNNDSGTGSLRDLITTVCAGSTITFDPSVRGAINLTSGELFLGKSLVISGPGANLLSVQRSAAPGTPNFRIFDTANDINIAISGLSIANGFDTTSGGIVNDGGTLTLTGVTITGNSATNFGGGGIGNFGGTLTVTNSTISGNSSNNNDGGGILNTGSTTLTNSTISGNVVTGTKGNGGGIADGTITVTNSTIAGNTVSAGIGGGIAVGSGSLTARNAIIALNSAPTGPDINGPMTSQGFNLIGNSSGTTISPVQATDQIGTSGSPIDPQIGPLQDNGGPTFTRALLSGSKAIDKGDSGGLTTDQRGLGRPVDFSSIANASGGDGADVGAFEVQVPTPTPTATPAATPTATATATPTATPPGAAQALNISTRMLVQGGNNVLIAGFIVNGSDQKTVAIRGIGPSLSQFFSGTLNDPTLELHTGNTTLATDDNWQDDSSQAAQLSSHNLAPADPKESGIVTTLPSQASYTAILAGKNGGTGIGVVELYDLNQSANSQLANISSRGFVLTDNNVMIGGFILGGSSNSARVVVRGIGPSLAQFGLSPVLADPTLELHNGNGVTFASDDNWQDDPAQAAQLIANNLAPADPKEAAIFILLPPGQFTAVLAGKNGGTGIGVVEVFNLH